MAIYVPCSVLAFWLAGSLAAAAGHVTRGAQTLEPAQLDEAWRLGRTRRPAELEAFTRPYYVVPPGGPGQPAVDVITEFRRAVMLTRRQADLGNFSWTQTDLARAMPKYAGLSTVRAEVWLPPAHMYVGTPAYHLDLYNAANRMVMPVEEKRDPIYSTLITGEASAMTGVTLETSYRDDVLRERGCCLLMIVDPNGEAVVKKEVDFGSLR